MSADDLSPREDHKDHTLPVVTHVVVSKVPEGKINNQTNVERRRFGSDGTSSDFGGSFSGLIQSLSYERDSLM